MKVVKEVQQEIVKVGNSSALIAADLASELTGAALCARLMLQQWLLREKLEGKKLVDE